MIESLFDYGAMQALERTVQFTGQRHRLLVTNIANVNTPYYRPIDLDTKGFQAALGEAIDRRRGSRTPVNGELKLRDTREVTFERDGLDVSPSVSGHNVMFHDRNDRDLERIMQGLAENTMVHNAALEMMRVQFGQLRSAIRERP